MPEPGEGCIWGLADSGSSIDIANHRRHFPGATLNSQPTGATYLSATGDPFENLGTFGVDFRTENYHEKHIEFNNGNVSMPIVSLRRWAKAGHRSTLDEDEGECLHKPTGEVDPYVARQGVYFMKMRVDQRISKGRPADFLRQGSP